MGGHAAEYALDASSANASQAVSNSDVITSIKVSSGYTADVTGKAIVIKGTDLVIDANTDNRPTDSSSKLVIGTTDTDSVTISQVGNPHKKHSATEVQRLRFMVRQLSLITVVEVRQYERKVMVRSQLEERKLKVFISPAMATD